jgi:HSP20 family protein
MRDLVSRCIWFVLNGDSLMNNLTRFNPFTDLIDPFNDDFFKGFSLRPIYRSSEEQPQIKLDVQEDDKAYVVKAEIPGVNKEDIKVSIEGNQVSMSAELKKEKEEKEDSKVIRSERYYGKAFRSFSLAESVDEAKSSAKYENGVLELTLPKKPSSSSKLLKIA